MQCTTAEIWAQVLLLYMVLENKSFALTFVTPTHSAYQSANGSRTKFSCLLMSRHGSILRGGAFFSIETNLWLGKSHYVKEKSLKAFCHTVRDNSCMCKIFADLSFAENGNAPVIQTDIRLVRAVPLTRFARFFKQTFRQT